MLKISFLRNIVLIALVVVIMFPLYDIFIAYPKFIKVLSQEAIDVSIRTSTHLSSMLNLQEIDLSGDAVGVDEGKITSFKRDLNIMKIKIFSKSGDIVYTSDTEDRKSIGGKKVFKDVISAGNVYTNIKKKGSVSLEGKVIEGVQIVETYVPIMKDGKFRGAIEIYYDISIAEERFEKIRTEVVVLVIMLATVLFAMVLITSFRASRIVEERDKLTKEREKLIVELRDTLDKVKTLRGLLPICSSCNKIRDKKGEWTHVDVYISDHSDAEFTHGYCPDCVKKQFPDPRKH